MARGAMAWLVFGLVGTAGCLGPVVEPEPVPDDYTDWYRVDSVGEVPGHGDSYRIIYVNDVGTEFDGEGFYDPGTVIVKEIRERNGDEAGDINYIGIMRKLVGAPDGGDLHGYDPAAGWLFTYLADDIGSDEHNPSFCWEDCHRAAPIDGTFFDYGQ
jgi:Cytochrome P460